MYSNTKIKGAAAELSVLAILNFQGFHVSIPFGENAPYDIIAESPTSKLYRIQVRASSWKNDHLGLSLRAVSKNYSRTLDRQRIEAFILWDATDCFIIPTAATITCVSTFTIRRKFAKNKQQKGIHDASLYKNAFHLLP